MLRQDELDSPVLRAIDANLNRAVEALRVVEDSQRFLRNDPFLTRECKDLRHELHACVLQFVREDDLNRARDCLGDVGRHLQAFDEYERDSLSNIQATNFHRLQQSLRTLEELFKLFSAKGAAALERLRYRSYVLEKAVQASGAAAESLDRVSLCVLVDGQSDRKAFHQLVGELLEAGATMIQLRDKQLSDRALQERAADLVAMARAHGAISVINDRADLARLAGADAVHLGQDDLPIAEARTLFGTRGWMGQSTHSREQARQAVLEGADYLGVGPLFFSRTKAFSDVPGLSLLRAVCQELSTPVFAIGGITLDNLPSVLDSGALRVAVGHAVTQAPSPGDAVRQFLSAMSAIPTQTLGKP